MADVASVVKAYVDAYNAGDDEALVALCAEDFQLVHHNRGMEISGREAFAALLGGFKPLFPDKRFVDRRAEYYDGDTAIIAHTWTGTATAEVPGWAEKAGDVARLDLCTLFTVRDGLIVEYHDYG